jgi:deazaflavin-dependent oxidoreductase (nitroreductase family)
VVWREGRVVGEAGGSSEWSGWNARIVESNKGVVEEFRSNAGRVGGYFSGAPMLLLHHVGARTGTERVNPLVYLRDGADMVVAATKGGAPTNPDWYHNLKAHPRVLVEVGTETFAVEAVEVIGDERDGLYRRLEQLRPAFAGYETRTDRVIPMFRLARVS